MTSTGSRFCWLLVIVALLVVGVVNAGEAPTSVHANTPEEKDPKRHASFLEIAKAGNVDLLFLGDSITDNWRSIGRTVWDKYWAPLKAANFGIHGDCTQHVIWRIRHGELDGIQPRVVVVMIGTNNGGDSAEDVALGIKTIVSDIQERSPTSRLLILAIFPRGQMASAREKNDRTNAILAGYADNRQVVYLNINQAFLTQDGVLPDDIMPDHVHPTEKGYRIWADAIQDTVRQLMQEDPTKLIPRFARPSSVIRISKIEALIQSGKVGLGIKVLEHIAMAEADKDHEAAATSLSITTAWKRRLDDDIEKRTKDGDVYAAADLAAGMAVSFSGHPAVKAYQEKAESLKKDPAYAAGQAYQKLRQVPYTQRKDQKFSAQYDAFRRRYPDGIYANLASALVPKE